MIRIDEYKIFNDNLTKLKECSADDHGSGEKYFMTDSLIEVIDFDRVKNEYIKDLSLYETPKSNDALIIKSNGDSIFIEFKNGKLNNKDEFDIRKKIYDSIIILTDIISKGISYTRCQTDYILVYNYRKNKDIKVNPKTNVQESKSRDIISRTLLEKGKENYIRFGLEIFKGYCLRNIYTYTEKEFDKYISYL